MDGCEGNVMSLGLVAYLIHAVYRHHEASAWEIER